MSTEKSALQIARASYQAKLPAVYANGATVTLSEGEPTTAADDAAQIQELFPTTYGAPIVTFDGSSDHSPSINAGVILSGGQAPGGHNVIAGLFDGLKSLNENNKLYELQWDKT